MRICPFCAEEIQEAAIKCRYCGSDLAAKKPSMGTTSVQAAVPAISAEKEKVYFSDGSITVTSTRAVLGSKTYAMSNITSVSLGENNSTAGCGVLVLLLGLMFAIGALGSRSLGVGLVGLLMLAVGVFLARQKSYIVRIGSSSGEANALENSDRSYIQKIVDAVSQAIIDRR